MNYNTVLFLSVLILSAVFNAGSCISVRNRHGQRSRRNEIQKNYKNYYYRYGTGSLTSTSCGETICTYSPDYPYGRINDAVNHVRQAFVAPALENERKRIDPTILFFYKNFTNFEPQTADRCQIYSNISLPLEGYADDNRRYYIINIPSMQQPVFTILCLAGGYCNNAIISGRPTCQQAYRNQKLLVLPADEVEFDVSDFKFRTFRIPNGCQCTTINNDEYSIQLMNDENDI